MPIQCGTGMVIDCSMSQINQKLERGTLYLLSMMNDPTKPCYHTRINVLMSKGVVYYNC